MNYSSLQHCLIDLEKNGHLVRVHEEVDPFLEMAAIHRRVFAADGPALLFERVKGSPFPAASNIFGTIERARFIFRGTMANVRNLIQIKSNPDTFLKQPLKMIGSTGSAINALPKQVKNSSVRYATTQISQLPQIHSWPDDGGAFITLPQVLSIEPESNSLKQSNLGMYRIQLSGNNYAKDKQIGLHYQIHRGIGIHHTKAIENNLPLKVSIFVGGPPAHTFAAVMPLPEGMSELGFAGLLAGRRFRYQKHDGYFLSADADFCITGTIENGLLPEGPFGDHLGYYSLQHEFPVLKAEQVFHRRNAIWPFTVVGRPPQEDSIFGQLIHELTGPVVPQQVPGLHAVHAVDAAGVHPLLLAIGSERYVPYQKRQPQELLTIANAILGFGQMSLAKYLLITAREDNPNLDIKNIVDYLIHVLERVDWSHDLHFQTNTTMDTLDYSGQKINQGSKVVIAAAGKATRKLGKKLPGKLKLHKDFTDPAIVMPGILTIQANKFSDYASAQSEISKLEQVLRPQSIENKFPLIILSDDSQFSCVHLNNFLWTTFTKSNPSHDIYGVDSFIENKHWGCRGPLIIDARLKPHHAPALEEDPKVEKKVDALAIKGKSLHGII